MSIIPLSTAGPAASSSAPAIGRSQPLAERSAVEGLGSDRDFSAVIGEAVSALAGQLRHVEAVSVAGIKGSAPTQDVVEQIMSAEQALQASIAVRDKIVAAYLEISRMAI
ncbi:MAG: flagellar hook-basal body complex protein FliE [Hyphomicrobiaceae bacterium]